MKNEDCDNCIWFTGTYCERKQEKVTETDTKDCDYKTGPDKY